MCCHFLLNKCGIPVCAFQEQEVIQQECYNSMVSVIMLEGYSPLEKGVFGWFSCINKPRHYLCRLSHIWIRPLISLTVIPPVFLQRGETVRNKQVLKFRPLKVLHELKTSTFGSEGEGVNPYGEDVDLRGSSTCRQWQSPVSRAS